MKKSIFPPVETAECGIEEKTCKATSRQPMARRWIGQTGMPMRAASAIQRSGRHKLGDKHHYVALRREVDDGQ